MLNQHKRQVTKNTKETVRERKAQENTEFLMHLAIQKNIN